VTPPRPFNAFSRRFHEDADLGQRFDRGFAVGLLVSRSFIAEAMATIG
jgi:hypothetical protein